MEVSQWLAKYYETRIIDVHTLKWTPDNCQIIWEICQKNKNDDAMRTLRGFMFLKGYRVGRNITEAIKIFTEGKSSEDMFWLGYIYSDEKSGKLCDIQKSVEYYENAITLGNVNSMVNLALLCEEEQCIAYNLSRAVELYKMAIEKNDAEAMNNLAVMYEEGRGDEQNIKTACELYLQASLLGYKIAKKNLIRILENL
mgnify:CR=1 FL=1